MSDLPTDQKTSVFGVYLRGSDLIFSQIFLVINSNILKRGSNGKDSKKPSSVMTCLKSASAEDCLH